MARPRAIKGEVEERLLEALEKGAFIGMACRYAGIAESVYYDEVKRNPEFAEKAARVRVRRAVVSLDAIFAAGAADWRALVEYLKLSFPDDFGKLRAEVTQAEPLKITLDFGSRDQT